MNLLEILKYNLFKKRFHKVFDEMQKQDLVENVHKNDPSKTPAFCITPIGKKYNKLLQKGIMVNAPFTEERLDMFLEELKNGKKFTEEELEKMNAEKVDA